MKKTFEQLLENLTWYNLIEKLKELFEAFWSRNISNIQAGENISIEGEGTEENPLVINSTSSSTGNYVPLSGTVEGQPITGPLEFEPYTETGLSSKDNDSDITFTLDLGSDLDGSGSGFRRDDSGISSSLLMTQTGTYLKSLNEDYKGIVGQDYFDKQGDPNAYAQMQDILDAIEALRQELTTP